MIIVCFLVSKWAPICKLTVKEKLYFNVQLFFCITVGLLNSFVKFARRVLWKIVICLTVGLLYNFVEFTWPSVEENRQIIFALLVGCFYEP